MKMIGRTIKIYVRGMSPRALRSIEIVNWSGKAFMGGRAHLPELKEISELSEAGIYFLLNNNEDTGLTEIYIGETDFASQRISQHSKKDWWENFIVFISKDLTKAHVRYLEEKLYQQARLSVSTLKIMNDVVPTGSRLPEPDMCAMDEFSSNMIFILETLGLGLFPAEGQVEDGSRINTRESTAKNYLGTYGMEFYLTLPKDIIEGKDNSKAIMIVRNGVFVLKAGSPIRREKVDSFDGHSYSQLWEQIINSDAVDISSNPKILVTNRDLEFKSPSAAAAIVRARATNGRTEWKRTTDEKSFIDCELETIS